MKTVVYLLGFVLLALYAMDLLALFTGLEPPRLAYICGDDRGTEECNGTIVLVGSILTLGLATAIFLWWRLPSAKRPIRRRARSEPRDFVPTASNSIMDEVVGRDELCEVIIQELKQRRTRRPHLLIGGPGAGKTAVMVKLTKMLAERGVVPVPIRLRDAAKLDFAELACSRYREVVDEETLKKGLGVKATGDTAWRWLRKEDRIVVLADGLEEAFAQGDKARDRDNEIRRAIRKARDQNLPLVMASRPHAPLRDVDAAVTELEPLSEEAAVSYVESATPTDDEHRLDWVTERGGVSASPLYLQVAKQLNGTGRFQHLYGRDDPDTLETRTADQAGLRHHLLKTWVDAVIDGYLLRRLALRQSERRSAVKQISALAYIGLLEDSLEVKFDHLEPAAAGGSEDGGPGGRRARVLVSDVVQEQVDAVGGGDPSGSPRRVRLALEALTDLEVDYPDGSDGKAPAHRYDPVDKVLRKWMAPRPAKGTTPSTAPSGGASAAEAVTDGADAQVIVDLALAATRGEQMRLVEAHGDHVRFQHSLMQAYLGSRFMAKALLPQDRGAFERQLDAALESPAGPSHEYLLSLVYMSRELVVPDEDDEMRRAAVACANRLRLAAEGRAEKGYPDEKMLDLYTAALEIDRQCQGACLVQLTCSMRKIWGQLTSGDETGLREAKLRLVDRLGDLLRALGREHEKKADDQQVMQWLTLAWEERCSQFDRLDPTLQRGGGGIPDSAPLTLVAVQHAYLDLFDMACHEPWYSVRLAIAQEIGIGRNVAFYALTNELHRAWEEPPVDAHETDMPTSWSSEDKQTIDQRHRAHTIAAWVAPMFVASVSDEARGHARRHLLRAIGRTGDRPTALPLSREVALSQGLKFVANMRRDHFATSVAGRVVLIEFAEDLLRATRYWYTQLTLLFALTLWALPDKRTGAADETESVSSPTGWIANPPRDQVHRWLVEAGSARDRSDGSVARGARARRLPRRKGRRLTLRPRTIPLHRRLHPFVFDAGELAARALQSRHPERHLWIDETGIVNRVGSRPPDPTVRRVHNLWIPPSAGWTALDMRARRLVADVLLLLNLAERKGPTEGERYTERADRADLPSCITGYRTPLHPELSIADPDRSTIQPGFRCAPGCPSELCPYPPRGDTRREEFGEAFCREQRTQLRRRPRNVVGLGPTRWQRASLHFWSRGRLKDLREFWDRMAERRSVPRIDDPTE